MKNPLLLIGAGQGWGAPHHEVAFGPKTLLESGLIASLQKEHKRIQWGSLLEPAIPCASGKSLSYEARLLQVQEFSEKLARALQACPQDYFPVVLGGDHTIAIGTWSGIITAQKAQAQFGLIWIDAHMDAHTPQTSLSQNIHGMPLGVLLGAGEPGLVNLCSNGAKLNPAHLVLIGVRSFESGEADFLKKLNVTIYFMEEVKRRGFKAIFQEALNTVTLNTKGFGISLDIDAFDPLIAPGTGTPVADGLKSVEELAQALKGLRDHPNFKALEIAEFDPTKDKDKQTQNMIEKLISSLC